MEMVAVSRYRYPVGLIMLDIDNFKSINDRYGHQQGDVALRHVAVVVQENSRDPDVAARYGGEEIALILPHTDLDGAYAIAERIRKSVAELEVPLLDGGGSLRITASVGVAAAFEGSKNELIHAADSRSVPRQAGRQEQDCARRCREREHGRWPLGFDAWVFSMTRFAST